MNTDKETKNSFDSSTALIATPPPQKKSHTKEMGQIKKQNKKNDKKQKIH